MDSTISQTELDTIVRGHIAHACNTNGVSYLINKIKVVYSNRMKSTGGFATYLNKTIKLSAVVAQYATPEEFRNIVIHETCHVIARLKAVNGWSIKPHGREWKRAMWTAGEEPKRCHSVKVPVDISKRVAIKCSCGKEMTMGKLQYKRMIQCVSRYRCLKCKAVITKDMVI